jgi:putative phosphoribosyl transferase
MVDLNKCIQEVMIPVGDVTLAGMLGIPSGTTGIVIFVDGIGSSRYSPRNQYIARTLYEGRLATLLFDLLTLEEEQVDLRRRHLRFDIDLLARRTIGATDWLIQSSHASNLNVGYFGSSIGAAATLIAAAERPDIACAVVSRGGRPDLAGKALPKVTAPILFLVGELDTVVVDLNQHALAQMSPKTEKKIEIIPGATHLFEESGTLELVAGRARDWFKEHLSSPRRFAPGQYVKGIGDGNPNRSNQIPGYETGYPPY